MGFDRIIGQEKALSSIRSSITNGKLHHGLVFHGPEGTGKHLTAVETARYLLCPSKSVETSSACQTCPTCNRSGKEQHPDLDIVLPDEKGNIGIDRIRELIKRMSYRSFEGIAKIAIIDPADKMAAPAQNAFLKLLEEPPEHTFLILVTTRPDMFLPTIMSRTIPVKFFPIKLEDSLKVLSETDQLPEMNDKIKNLISGLQPGGPGQILKLDFEYLESFSDQLEGIFSDSGKIHENILEFANFLASHKEHIAFNLHLMRLFFKSLLLYEKNRDNAQAPVIWPETVPLAVQKIRMERIPAGLEKIGRLSSKESFNLNLNLQFENLLLDLI